jgi:1,4-dihydroxy-2-naphthoyl-CoA synthase
MLPALETGVRTTKMESLTTLLFKVSEHVAYITLNRPAAVNAVSLKLAEELEEVARECDESSSVRSVLLTSAGRIFRAGDDLKSFAAQEPNHLPTHFKRVNLFFHSAIQCFTRMRAPVVVAVNGPAAGYGMALALTSGDPARQRAAVDFVIKGLEKGTLKPIVDRVFPFDKIVDAHRYLEASGQIGKIVVTI